MRTLYLLRHAKSDWGDTSLHDAARPLSPRGVRAGALMARHLRDSGVQPDLVISSRSVRTRMTVDAIAPVFEAGTPVRFDRRLYGAAAPTLLDIVSQVPEHVKSLFLVGHNPGMQDLATALAGSGDPSTVDRVRAKYPTCALATLTFDGTWATLAPAGATLESFVTPADLA